MEGPFKSDGQNSTRADVADQADVGSSGEGRSWWVSGDEDVKRTRCTE